MNTALYIADTAVLYAAVSGVILLGALLTHRIMQAHDRGMERLHNSTKDKA
jgi:hypothetical protein